MDGAEVKRHLNSWNDSTLGEASFSKNAKLFWMEMRGKTTTAFQNLLGWWNTSSNKTQCYFSSVNHALSPPLSSTSSPNSGNLPMEAHRQSSTPLPCSVAPTSTQTTHYLHPWRCVAYYKHRTAWLNLSIFHEILSEWTNHRRRHLYGYKSRGFRGVSPCSSKSRASNSGTISQHRALFLVPAKCSGSGIAFHMLWERHQCL